MKYEHRSLRQDWPWILIAGVLLVGVVSPVYLSKNRDEPSDKKGLENFLASPSHGLLMTNFDIIAKKDKTNLSSYMPNLTNYDTNLP